VPKPEREFHDADLIPWEPVPGAPGQWQKILSHDPESGSVTRLLKCEPNLDTSDQGVQVHDFWEEVFILEGGHTDLRLNQSFRAGYYACRPPGMPHGPWKHGPLGSVSFEIRGYPPAQAG
jgi:hypothetical protein